MAISYPKPHLLPLLLLSFFLLLLNKVKSQETVHFNFPNFLSVTKDDITFQGDARLSWGTLQLTETDKYDNPFADQSLGRASYTKPVQIRKGSKGKVASFNTSFTFVIKPPPKDSGSLQAEGLAFFIVPVGFDIPNKSYGKYLTLFNDTTALKPSMNQIFAVEFDTHVNPELGDPVYEHIGIDVNSIESVKTERWNTIDVANGSRGSAHIRYNAVSKELTVTLTYTNGNFYRLFHEIDFTSFLPEWVTVGFSGATGWGAETHNILSWKFSTDFSESSTCSNSPSHAAEL